MFRFSLSEFKCSCVILTVVSRNLYSLVLEPLKVNYPINHARHLYSALSKLCRLNIISRIIGFHMYYIKYLFVRSNNKVLLIFSVKIIIPNSRFDFYCDNYILQYYRIKFNIYIFHIWSSHH